MSVKHPVERGDEGRGLFDSIAERGSNLSSSPTFFVACVLLIVAWVLSYGLGWSDHLRFFLGDAIGAITLLLVALLKNAELRAEAAVQDKLDAIALALLEVQRGTDDGAADELEKAIGATRRSERGSAERAERIDVRAAQQQLEVQVRPAGAAGRADRPDALTDADRLPASDGERREVRVERAQPEAVADDDHVAPAGAVEAGRTTCRSPPP